MKTHKSLSNRYIVVTTACSLLITSLLVSFFGRYTLFPRYLIAIGGVVVFIFVCSCFALVGGSHAKRHKDEYLSGGEDSSQKETNTKDYFDPEYAGPVQLSPSGVPIGTIVKASVDSIENNKEIGGVPFCSEGLGEEIYT